MEWNGEEALAISRGVYKWSGNLWRELELVNGDDIKESREGEMHGFCCWGYMPQLLIAHQTPFSSSPPSCSNQLLLSCAVVVKIPNIAFSSPVKPTSQPAAQRINIWAWSLLSPELTLSSPGLNPTRPGRALTEPNVFRTLKPIEVPLSSDQ
jgi:hypothetical protein